MQIKRRGEVAPGHDEQAAPVTSASESNALQDYHPVVQRVLRNRRIEEPAQISHSLSDLISPDKLYGMTAATARLVAALQQQQRILIVGDYDVDGATSTVLAIEALQQMGSASVGYCVPNRFEYGYGLSLKLAQDIVQSAPDLVITVDNGIASIDGIALLKQHGVDTIVTDHHLAGDMLPEAVAIINPNQPACDFPSKMLAGVGVVFYLMLALRAHLQSQDWFEQQGLAPPPLVDMLDLVALGTAADLVPLDHNNRILVAQGVARMRSDRTRAGVRALMAIAKRPLASLVANDLGFVLGPRLNAAGRLADISTGIECLLASDPHAASELAKELDAINQERKSIEQGMQQEAFATVDAMDWPAKLTQYGVALFNDQWHEGVVGLVASRVKDKLHLPTAVFAPGEDGHLKGSCRSTKQVHIRDVLATLNAQHPGLIIKFGGHAMAAGLSIEADKFAVFEQAFNDEVKRLTEHLPNDNAVLSDGPLQETELSLDLAQQLRTLAPWGQAFPAPVFDGTFEVLNARLVGKVHLKLTLQVPSAGKTGGGRSIDAIAFRYLDSPDKPTNPKTIKAVYSLDVNEFRGVQSVQLIIQHIELIA